MRKAMTVLAAASLLGSPAMAQENGPLADRMERIERDLMMMQRQLYRGEAGAAPRRAGEYDEGISDDQLRSLNGRFEELEHKIRKLGERMDKMQADVDLRLRDVEQKGAGLSPAAPAAEPQPVPAADAAKPQNLATQKPQDFSEDGHFQDSREHYNYAFRLLNQAKLDQAGKSFEDFVKRYPEDPLIGNAYYWLGETYYARRDFVNAANNFRIGFEKSQTGPKAPDNLLKLGMALGAIGKSEEACVVLAQVKVKFPKGAISTVQKAETERARLGCK